MPRADRMPYPRFGSRKSRRSSPARTWAHSSVKLTPTAPGLLRAGVGGPAVVEGVVNGDEISVRGKFEPVRVSAHREVMALGCGEVEVIEVFLADAAIRAAATKRDDIELQVRRGAGGQGEGDDQGAETWRTE